LKARSLPKSMNIVVRIANPDFSLAHMQQTFPFKDPNDREHFMQELRMATFSR
jgi:hypothetical protein